MSRIDKSIVSNGAVSLAKLLLGTFLVHRVDEETLAGRIIETEAYLHRDDPGSHSFKGQTRRNRSMFGRAGLAYVYRVYGIHVCLNVVALNEGAGEAVLIRAVEPIRGINLMKRNRGRDSLFELCNGPAKLTQALGITINDDGKDLLVDSKLYLATRIDNYCWQPLSARQIVTKTRIGLSRGRDLPYRFYVKDSRFVSCL